MISINRNVQKFQDNLIARKQYKKTTSCIRILQKKYIIIVHDISLGISSIRMSNDIIF